MKGFTPRAQKVLSLCRSEAVRLGHGAIEPEHLLLGLLALEQGVGLNSIKRQVNPAELRDRLEREMVCEEPPVRFGDVQFSSRSKKAVALAGKEAHLQRHGFVGTDHLLLGLMRENGLASEILRSLNFDQNQVRAEILDGLGLEKLPLKDLSAKLDSLSATLARLQFEVAEIRQSLPKEITHE